MTDEDLAFSPISEVAAKLRRGETNSVALTELMLDRIERLEPQLNAFVTVTDDLARAQAVRADQELAAGRDRGPLHGIPVAIKDLINTKGVRTTCGSKFYADFVPNEDAPVVVCLEEAGAVNLGKTGLHELAFGSVCNNPFFGAIANPWRLDHHPGGSSGGSAVAVATGMAYGALGSDTGCSIRQPAHCCGIVGLKPSFGLVSKRGAMALTWTLDHIGPMARGVRDTALLLQAIAGYDPADPYSADQPPVDYLTALDDSLEDVTLGITRPYFFEEGDRDVVEAIEAAIPMFEQLGGRVVEVRLPGVEDALAAAQISFNEALATQGPNWRTDPESFSPELRADFESMTQITMTDYVEAQQIRRQFARTVEEVMADCDLLLAPTSNIPAAPIAKQPPEHFRLRYKNTAIFDLTGQPSISVPCGFTQGGLPVGLMITGRMFEDREVLRAAQAFEQATAWHRERPPIR